MLEQYIGTWVDPEITNFQKYLVASGVGFFVRKIALTIKDTCIMKVEGNKLSITSESVFKNHTVEWTLNEECQIETTDGRHFWSTLTFEDGQLVERQRPIKEEDASKCSIIKRRVEGNKFIVECDCFGVVATFVYIKKE
uniref:FABP domain-containing protein n=1 Tax=Rhabditophanes sp. KR3021 TaxID=114890 RepID=A0AC35U718_9BILA